MCSTMMSIAIVTMKAALMFYRRVAKIVRWIDRFVVQRLQFLAISQTAQRTFIMSQKVEYIVAIPSRYASTRLAAKPLAIVDGKPMIVKVCEKALESSAKYVMACIDHEEVAKALEPLAQANERLRICMTSQKPRSGTERIAEMIANEHIDMDTIVVNVQGDEPLITKDHIDEVAALLASSGASMSTLCSEIHNINDVFDPNCVKCVMDMNNFALYFSRTPIPYERDNFALGKENVSELKFKHYHHIGIYGYKAGTILDYLSKEPADIEVAESLEQLRLLHYGMKIAVATTDNPPEIGVDTIADLERVNRIFAQGKA